MKISVAFPMALLMILAISCQEVGPAVNMGLNTNSRSDTTFVDPTPEQAQARKALLEEFTGVRCVNCPRAHNTINTLQQTYPGQIIPVGIHTGIFSQPYSGRNDFRIPEGSSIENLLGGAQGYPAGAINRRLFSGESAIIIADQKWSNYIGGEVQGNSPVNISLVSDVDVNNAEAAVEVRVRINEAQQGPLHLTLYLVEDYIEDFQLTPQGVDSTYIHKHVLRQCITPYNGQALSSPTYEVNRVFVNNFVFAINPAWNLANCQVVAFVHRIGTQVEVLQANFVTLN
ncbi:MAG: Omp28-related outer membrane protein [Bacteroidia bacterium]